MPDVCTPQAIGPPPSLSAQPTVFGGIGTPAADPFASTPVPVGDHSSFGVFRDPPNNVNKPTPIAKRERPRSSWEHSLSSSSLLEADIDPFGNPPLSARSQRGHHRVASASTVEAVGFALALPPLHGAVSNPFLNEAEAPPAPVSSKHLPPPPPSWKRPLSNPAVQTSPSAPRVFPRPPLSPRPSLPTSSLSSVFGPNAHSEPQTQEDVANNPFLMAATTIDGTT